MSLDVNLSEPDEFNCLELHNSIRDVAKLKGIENFEYHVDFICGTGENYVANLFRVFIKNKDNVDDVISVIVKTLVNTTRRDLFHELHRREVSVYREILPKYKKIQHDFNVEDGVVVPECLLSTLEKGNEIIVLEDMQIAGYQMDNKFFNNTDFLKVSTVITELAKFHALSYTTEKMYPNLNLKAQFEDLIFSDIFLNKSKLRKYFSESFEISLKVIDDYKTKVKLETIRNKVTDILRTFLVPGTFNALCHGDLWSNNLLFRSEGENRQKVCFLDFQALRYANPITDIFYFIYLSTDSKFRSMHFKSLKALYYNGLETFLSFFGYNMGEIYPNEVYDKEWELFHPFGLLIALLELRITTTEPECDPISLKANIGCNVEDLNEDFEQVNLFRIRINDVVSEATENGVLDLLCKLNA